MNGITSIKIFKIRDRIATSKNKSLNLSGYVLKGRLAHFSPVLNFYTPRKRQKTFRFLTFSGGIEM